MTRIAWILIIAAALLVACGGNEESADNGDQTVVDTMSGYVADSDLYHAAAEKLTNEFQKSLKSELMAGMNDGGAVNAIEVCAGMAPEIQQMYTEGNWAIKRVSEKYRNPDNRPDTTEQRVLAQFAAAQPDPFIESWQEQDSVVQYAYYKPIRTSQLCLNCHGGMQTLAPGVYDKLKELYPMDKATGYEAGELRGMFVVSATWPAATEQARMIVTDSVAADSM